MLTRTRILSELPPLLARHDFILAGWLGGSDAFGRADDRSDVDICLIVENGAIEQAAAAFQEAVTTLSPIRVNFRLPWPTWHGFHQAFYQLADASEETMIDWLFVERGQPHPWFEVERHGTPKVLFDKEDLIRPTHIDRAATDAAVRRRVEELRLKYPLFRHMPLKLIDRGLPVDAAHFYQSMILRQLVDLLRCVHCPERWDYGFRYVNKDLPTAAYQTLERLAYCSEARKLPDYVRQADALFRETLAEWDRRAG